jgi:hypothetical protein
MFEGRMAGIAYIENDGKFITLPYLESASQGNLRLYPGYQVKNNGLNEKLEWYAKGYGEESLGMPISAQAALATSGVKQVELPEAEAYEMIICTSKKYADSRQAILESGPDSGVDPEAGEVEGIGRQRVGWFKGSPEDIDFAVAEDEPDFGRLISSWEARNPVYGEITKEVFESKNGKYRFLFCRDKENRAWISQVEICSSTINERGLNIHWIATGALTTPAAEYHDQLTAADGIRYNKYRYDLPQPYKDAFELFVSKIPVIREYIESLPARASKTASSPSPQPPG